MHFNDDHYVSERFRQLEDEQEQLTSSLLALSCHFAQVQFRLQQICKAPTEEKDRLLRELEEFSFRECPDILEAKRLLDPKRVSDVSWSLRFIVQFVMIFAFMQNLHSTHSDKLNIDRQQLKEVQLIEQLKQQLNDLEAFAYERGEGDLPSSKIIEKQRAVIDHLQQLMPLNLNQFERLSSEELQSEVNQALKKLVNPIKVKEQLVQQLQTQIVDLERFVEFLQGSSAAQPNDTIRNALAKKKPNPVGKDSGIFATLDLRAALEISINEMVEICEQYDLSSDAGANRRSLTMSQSEVTRLLTTIDNILSTHVKLKRSSDAMFKAFISAALNYGKLSPWLRMIFHCKEILDDCYTSWSYCTVVGIDEICQSLDRLSTFQFCVPVDFAIRPFDLLNDAF
ncbi:RUN domain-containing protein 1 [Trichinella spiralis]|uniref:RUN domain-containing protein 1 n=1 Tax=Trichinella spiralis TaxID=6334 RepID=UPI0001EFBB0A|nr:RUN domain-containing protein 1 [Trichinella spiralis]